MARTRLFSFAQRALSAAGPSRAQAGSALTRRQALTLGAAAMLSGCATLPSTSARQPDIAIVGGGVAGLTVAYRLARAGRRATLYESSGRLGGRMFTQRGFNAEGMFCELGGELVDSNHAPLFALAQELGVGLQRLKPEGVAEESLYAIGGVLRSERDMLQAGQGPFAAVARRIAEDKTALTDDKDDWTARARALDQSSLAAYLAAFRGQTEDWVLDLLDLAYWGEYGLPTDQQSSLNLVDFIGADLDADFALFGESDEAFRIQGGSSALTDALASRLGDGIGRRTGFALAGLADEGRRLRLRFQTPQGAVEARHDVVVLALPFTRLREVDGIASLGLDPMKLRSIRELGYGDNAKLMIGARSRPTEHPAAGRNVGFNGEIYAPAFQVVWDTSRGQPGTRGIVTNFTAGVQDHAVILERLQTGLRAISPAIADSLDPSNISSFFWAGHPHTKGSYAGAKVGQYTTLLEAAGTPELDGRLQFAGEHTSVDFLGFMCGGVESGERVAAALLSPIAQDTAA